MINTDPTKNERESRYWGSKTCKKKFISKLIFMPVLGNVHRNTSESLHSKSQISRNFISGSRDIILALEATSNYRM